MSGRAQRPVTGRVLLARMAEQVIALEGGVSTTAGRDRRWVTADLDREIEGVVVAETGHGHGQADIDLHLVADWPPEPLQQLAAQLRRRLRRSAAMAGLGDRVGEIGVSIHDVREPDHTGAVG